MKTAESSIEQPGRTLLKSTSHVRVLNSRGNSLRSVLVGLQFGIIHLPYEITAVVIWPFVRDIASVIFGTASNLIFVLHAACTAIYTGLTGVLDATDEPVVNLDEEKD